MMTYTLYKRPDEKILDDWNKAWTWDWTNRPYSIIDQVEFWELADPYSVTTGSV